MARPQQQGQRPAKPTEAATVVEEVVSPFRHYVPGEKPRTDPAYFELLLVSVLRSSGEIAEFDEVWPRAVQAFAGMNLLRLSTYAPGEVADAITSVGGPFAVRTSGKSALIVEWAAAFWRIRQIYGSFRQYVRTFESEGFEALLDDLRGRLGGLTPEFMTDYLREAGEKPPAPERSSAPSRSQQPQRPASATQSSSATEGNRRPQEEGDRPDRRRQRQRQRGAGQRPQPGQQQQSRAPKQPIVASQQTSEAKPSVQPATDPQQQRRRRNRRFFRRNRGGGEQSSQASGQAPATE